ncbi:hypothetical protein XCR_3638 [Xanthomonas campestris pv. raphani 756C]|nr:hypothetical protein XCR_3638 [Xanthomonas campestris pv. raphani 756C]
MARRRQTTLRHVSAVHRRCSACADAIDVAETTFVGANFLSN